MKCTLCDNEIGDNEVMELLVENESDEQNPYCQACANRLRAGIIDGCRCDFNVIWS